MLHGSNVHHRLNNSADVTYTTNNGSLSMIIQCLEFLNLYYVLLLIVVGVVGNLLSFLVFTVTHLKYRSSSYFLAALAVSDLGFLITLFFLWLQNIGIDFFNRQGWCQALIYASSVFSSLSVWLTVAFTVERLIAVQYPLQRPLICTVRRAKITIFVLVLITLSVHVYLMFSAGVNDGRLVCELLPEYHHFMRVVNILDTVLTLVIPLVLIITSNALIIKRVYASGRNVRGLYYGPSFISQNTQVSCLQQVINYINENSLVPSNFHH